MNKDKVKLLICTMGCITLIICGILFWPTLYRYDSMNDGKRIISVRINRITGNTEFFNGTLGWEKPFNPKDYAPPQRLPAAEIAKLIGENQDPFYNFGRSPLPKGSYVTIPDKKDFSFKSEIYNGTKYPIGRLIVIIEAKNKDETIRWKRKYQAKLNGQTQPLASAIINVEPSDTFGVAFYIWSIEEVISP
jgi:hypothetical protein